MVWPLEKDMLAGISIRAGKSADRSRALRGVTAPLPDEHPAGVSQTIVVRSSNRPICID